MFTKYVFVVAALMTVMLIGVIALTTSNSASAISFLSPNSLAIRELNAIRPELIVTPEVTSGNFLQIPLTPTTLTSGEFGGGYIPTDLFSYLHLK